MTHLVPSGGRSIRPRRTRRRWTAAQKARHLDAFRRSGLSAIAFCRTMRISPSTFALWRRETRRGTPPVSSGATPVAFARVELGPAITPVQERGDAIRLVVRGVTGHEAALDGVDGATAVRLVALVLAARR